MQRGHSTTFPPITRCYVDETPDEQTIKTDIEILSSLFWADWTKIRWIEYFFSQGKYKAPFLGTEEEYLWNMKGIHWWKWGLKVPFPITTLTIASPVVFTNWKQMLERREVDIVKTSLTWTTRGVINWPAQFLDSYEQKLPCLPVIAGADGAL